MKVPKTNQLGVQIKDGLYYKFTGFREQVTPSTPPYVQLSWMCKNVQLLWMCIKINS